MVLAGAVMQLNLKGQILMRLGVLLKSVLPYLILYRIFAFIILPKKSHKESRNLFINEAKKLYQKEFQRWFTLVSEVNPLLRFFRIKDAGISTLYIMGSEDHMFLPSIRKLVANHKSAVLKVVQKSGHVVNIDRPLEFNQLTVQFLQSSLI
jgi:pimeloyl-ACP methyl ester carboxylesterase